MGAGLTEGLVARCGEGGSEEKEREGAAQPCEGEKHEGQRAEERGSWAGERVYKPGAEGTRGGGVYCSRERTHLSSPSAIVPLRRSAGCAAQVGVGVRVVVGVEAGVGAWCETKYCPGASAAGFATDAVPGS